jgi:putative ABC transport system ATP-binding protein
VTAANVEAIVVLRDVCKSYASDGRRQTVLDGLSLDVHRGEMLAVVGPSGCGKTTLLNIVGALDRPDGGSARSCGLDLTAASTAELTAYRARSVGFIFQFYNLLPTLTALENVQAGLGVAGIGRQEATELARRFLERVGLGESADKFPGQLSGGEQQRVAIARAIAKNPALVLADEPTGNLDERSGAQVVQLMRELNAETRITFVVVSHNPAVSSTMDRIVSLEDGRLAGDGSPRATRGHEAAGVRA